MIFVIKLNFLLKVITFLKYFYNFGFVEKPKEFLIFVVVKAAFRFGLILV